MHKTVIFDVGHVIVKWQPEVLIRTILGDAVAADRVSRDVVNPEFFAWTDAGMSWDDAIEKRSGQYPDDRAVIESFAERWDEAVPGLIEGTVQIIESLHQAGVPLYALTNFSSPTFARTRARFPVFERFLDIVVSGDEGLIKPDERIYQIMLSRAKASAWDCVFIDDTIANIEAANRLGITGLHFTGPQKLKTDLEGLGIPV